MSTSSICFFQDLADSDAGAYRCAIVNPHGKGNANFNLKLTGLFLSCIYHILSYCVLYQNFREGKVGKEHFIYLQ